MILATLASLPLVFMSCASTGPYPEGFSVPAFPDSENYAEPVLTQAQRLIVDGGKSLVGKPKLVVNGVTYPNDCSGLARAAYAFAGIDLAYRASELGGGVRGIYAALSDLNLIYAVRYPEPADLVFWDDTWDANGNGVADDKLTHVGVVISVEENGTISYLHYHYRKGAVIERMNLLHPDDRTVDELGPVNAFMRMRGSPAGPGDTAADLFKAFGMGYDLPKEAATLPVAESTPAP